jgi:[ribosomal protein S5]-alanine N-acetyltransferase
MSRITTNRLVLRLACEDDLKELHSIFSSPLAMKYWSTLPHTHENQTSEFINAMMSTQFDEGEDFIVELDGVVIGKAGFWRFPEIGYIFHPDYWGKGLASEAIAALIDYGFRERKIANIVADVDPRNLRSIRMLERLGFHETRREANTIKIGQDWCDSVYFSLNAPNG